jgi:hypothetical protein
VKGEERESKVFGANPVTFHDRLAEVATGRLAGGLVLGFVLISFLWFRFGPAGRLAAAGLPLPDTWIGYTPEELYRGYEVFGVEGRRWYQLFLVGDFLYPLLFAAASGAVIVLALKRIGRLSGSGRWLLLAPLAVLLLDWVENGIQFFLVSAFPRRFDGLASFAAVITAAKMGLINLVLILVVLAGAVVLLTAVRNRGAGPVER